MNLDKVEFGVYPQKPYFSSKVEKVIFSLMIAFSVVIYSLITSWYVWGGA